MASSLMASVLVLLLSLYPIAALGLAEYGQITFPGVLPPGTTNVSILSSGIVRDFLLSIPSAYDGSTPVPLIFSFHGRNKGAEYQQELSQFSNSSFNKDGIAVYPYGLMVRYRLCMYIILRI
jgi:poly(3-hydroxybutyrate) depolymerase